MREGKCTAEMRRGEEMYREGGDGGEEVEVEGAGRMRRGGEGEDRGGI